MKTRAHFLLSLKIIVFTCLLSAILGIYWPGLSGGFMLDDYSSLPSLFKTIDSCGFWCGVMSGSTGPTGRPISLLTFAVQANYWPHAYSFKLINVFIHLANTALVFFILKLLLKRLYPASPFFYISLFSAVLWAIWPLQVSSVLYAIQRMVLISSFFVLLGVLFYLYCRVRLETIWKGELNKWLFLCFGLSIFGLLAIYSKESGILLLVYICVLEGSIFRIVDRKEMTGHSESDIYLKIFRLGGLCFPFSLFVIVILYKYVGNAEYFYMTREFNLEERLLTQGSVITDYIQSLILPKVSDLGLYHDAYPVSKSLFEPFSTLISWLFIAITICLAWLLRKKYLFLSIAIFWFYAGHILESTILPLELYFEHRNYLPSIFIALALVLGTFKLFATASRLSVRYIFMLISLVYVCMILAITYSQTRLWGNEFEYAIVQAHENPDSVRARTLLVDLYNRLGEVDKGYEEMLKMQQDFPRVAGLIVGNVEFACFDAKYPLLPIETVAPQLEAAKFGYGAIVTVAGSLKEIFDGECSNVSIDYLLEIIYALKRNPAYANKIRMLKGYEVSIYIAQGRIVEALDVLASIELSSDQWTTYVGLLATNGELKKALAESDKGLEILKSQPQYEYYYSDLKRLRQVILSDLKKEEGL